MDSGFDKNKSELGILVLPVPLKMLPDGDSLLDEIVAILWKSWSHSLAFQDTEDFISSDKSDLKYKIINIFNPNSVESYIQQLKTW